MNYRQVMFLIDEAIKRETKKHGKTSYLATSERVEALIDLRNEILTKESFGKYLSNRRKDPLFVPEPND